MGSTNPLSPKRLKGETDLFAIPQRTGEEWGCNSARKVHIRHCEKCSVKCCD